MFSQFIQLTVTKSQIVLQRHSDIHVALSQEFPNVV